MYVCMSVCVNGLNQMTLYKIIEKKFFFFSDSFFFWLAKASFSLFYTKKNFFWNLLSYLRGKAMLFSTKTKRWPCGEGVNRELWVEKKENWLAGRLAGWLAGRYFPLIFIQFLFSFFFSSVLLFFHFILGFGFLIYFKPTKMKKKSKKKNTQENLKEM